MIDFNLFSRAPDGDLYTKWEDYKSSLKKLSPEEANKYKIIVIGTGLAGASASATFPISLSPKRPIRCLTTSRALVT